MSLRREGTASGTFPKRLTFLEQTPEDIKRLSRLAAVQDELLREEQAMTVPDKSHLKQFCTSIEIEHVERLTLVGPMSERNRVYDWLYDNGYSTERGGPYQDSKTWPNVDTSRFLIVARRTMEKRFDMTTELPPIEELERVWKEYSSQPAECGDELSKEDRLLFDAADKYWSALVAELKDLREFAEFAAPPCDECKNPVVKGLVIEYVSDNSNRIKSTKCPACAGVQVQ